MLSYKPLWITLASKGINKGELSEKADIGVATVTRMAKGKPVNLSVLMKICDALEVPLTDVVKYTPRNRG